jgi:hypothetical protein
MSLPAAFLIMLLKRTFIAVGTRLSVCASMAMVRLVAPPSFQTLKVVSRIVPWLWATMRTRPFSA